MALELKNSRDQTMLGTEFEALFLKCRIQPVMFTGHPMWLYIPAPRIRPEIAP
jgi:hypothetical protein